MTTIGALTGGLIGGLVLVGVIGVLIYKYKTKKPQPKPQPVVTPDWFEFNDFQKPGPIENTDYTKPPNKEEDNNLNAGHPEYCPPYMNTTNIRHCIYK
jgi:hypothetical protein